MIFSAQCICLITSILYGRAAAWQATESYLLPQPVPGCSRVHS